MPQERHALLSSSTRLTDQDVQVGRYTVRAQLGAGATSTVFRVDDEYGAAHALKLLHETGDDGQLRAEYARLSSLDHPALVAVQDLGRLVVPLSWQSLAWPVGTPYLVMAYVEGQPAPHALRHVADVDRLPLFVLLLQQLLSALAQIHGRGLVHHDVKPDNVLVRSDGLATLVDLGLARAEHSRLGAARGSVPYMAPEALAGTAGHRADLYAVGATLYETASGRAPFIGQGGALIEQILYRSPPALEVPWLDESMRALVMRLLDKNPLRRPSSARAVLADLARMRGDDALAVTLCRQQEVLPPAFVGHEPLVQRLVDYVEHPSTASPVLLVGGPGAGKSALVAEAVRRVRVRLLGDVGPADAGDLLWLRGDPRAFFAEIPDGGLDDVASFVAEQVEARAATSLALVQLSGTERDALALRLAEMLVGDRIPNVSLVVELREPGCVRDRFADELWQRIDLAPLRREEVRALMVSMGASDVGSEVAERVRMLGGGNPALAVELTRQWMADGQLELVAYRASMVSELAVWRRCSLPTSQRRVLDALSVWSGRSSVARLATYLERPPEDLWDDLLALRSSADVVMTDGEVVFASETQARAWLECLECAERARLHRRAAQLADDPGVLAEHIFSAGPSSADEWSTVLDGAQTLARTHRLGRALSLAEAAARRISGRQQTEAARLAAKLLLRRGQYEQALAHLDSLPVEDSLLMLRAEIRQRQGAYDEATSLLQDALPKLSAARAQQARVLLGRLSLRRGDPVAALAVGATEADVPLGSVQQDVSVTAGLLEVNGLAHFYQQQMEQARDCFQRGQRLVSPLEDDALKARFESMLGMVAFARGSLATAADHYARAVGLARGAHDAHGLASYLGNLGSSQLELGRYDSALEYLTEAGRALARLGRGAECASALCNLGSFMLLLGQLQRAEQLCGQAARRAEDVGNRIVWAYTQLLAVDIVRRKGRPRDALAVLVGAERVVAEAGNPHDVLTTQLARSETLLELGDAQQALRCLDTAEQGVDACDSDARGRVARVRARALVSQSSNEASVVATTTATLADFCAQLQSRAALGELWRTATVLADLLASVQRHVAARRVLQQGHRAWETVMAHTPEPYQEGLSSDPDARILAARWKEWVEGSSALVDSAPELAGGERRLRRLLKINKRLNSELHLPRLLEMVMDAVIDLTDAERGFLLLAEGNELVVRVARNIDQRSLEGNELELSRSIAQRAARSGEPVMTVDAADDERFQQALSVSDLHLRSVLAVPLRVKGTVVGTIYVDHRLRRGVFSEEDAALAQDFADQAAIAIDNARLLADNRLRQREVEHLNRQLADEVRRQESELVEAREQLRSNQQALQVRYDYASIVGRSTKMQDLFRLLDRVTDSELPVVVTGESGTGKELVARAIHHNGPRSERPFVGENCAAIPHTLLESVLFGHVRGAFTGADRDRKGLFEIADGGTLLLDEVGDMSAAMQAKLLRVLQDGEVRRVGGSGTRSVNVRVIAASNKDLSQLVQQGNFRQDLFYRLNVVRIEVPPLRERREDIPLLVQHFVSKHAGDPPPQIDKEVFDAIMAYAWPGNVRELENEVMRMVAMAGAKISIADLSSHIVGLGCAAPLDPNDLRLRQRVERLERELIQQALKRTEGNHTRAAKLLGLSRFGLLKKLKRYYPDQNVCQLKEGS